MADINITCPKCQSETTISEFVDASNLKCHSCGATLEKPGGLIQAATKETNSDGTTPPAGKSKLRVKRRKKEPLITEPNAGASLKDIVNQAGNYDVNNVEKIKLHPKVKNKENHINHATIAGLLFLVLGGAMGYLRYGNILPDKYLDISVQYSWIVLLVFHGAITLKALTDNMMQGILCLLVPGYSLFYLFAVSDNFYLRAIFAGLLIGIGLDAAAELKVRAGALAKIAGDFIASGGGNIH